MYRRHSRTIDSFKHKYKNKALLDIPSELEYAELIFACIHGGRHHKSAASDMGRPNQR